MTQDSVPSQMALRFARLIAVILAWLVAPAAVLEKVVQETPSVAYSTSLSVVLPLCDEARAYWMAGVVVGLFAPASMSWVAPLPEPTGGACTV